MNNSKLQLNTANEFVQNSIFINNELPHHEGSTHFNINYHSTSLIGRFLSPYTLTPFSADKGSTAYACPETYFVKQRYVMAGNAEIPNDLEQLHGQGIIKAKRIISSAWRYSEDTNIMDNQHGDNVKEVLRDVLLAKLYAALLINLELYGEDALKYLTNPYVCYLTKCQSDGSYIDTVPFKQLSWVTVVVQKAIDEINATIERSDHYFEVLARFIDAKLENIEKDITFYDPASHLNGRRTPRDIRSIAKDYFCA